MNDLKLAHLGFATIAALGSMGLKGRPNRGVYYSPEEVVERRKMKKTKKAKRKAVQAARKRNRK